MSHRGYCNNTLCPCFLTLHSLNRIARVIKLNNPNCERLCSKYKRSPFNSQDDLQSLATSLSCKPDDLSDLNCQVHCLLFHLPADSFCSVNTSRNFLPMNLCSYLHSVGTHSWPALTFQVFTQMAYFEWDLPWLSYLKWLPFSYLIISFPFL